MKIKKTKHKKQNTNKGITLIALVITIIVMLILVGVTISMAVNGGLFEYAGRAATKTNKAMQEEQDLANGGVTVGGWYYNTVEDYLNNTPSEKNYEVIGEEIEVENGDFKYVKLQNGGIQITRYIGSSEEVTIPSEYDGYKVYSVGNIEATVTSGQRYNIFGVTSSETNTTVKTIVFEEGIKKIGTAAFNGCSGLTCELDLQLSLNNN